MEEVRPASARVESVIERGKEYRAIIYNAARDGKIGRLQIFLENQQRDFIDMCLNVRDGSTEKIALVIACRNGHLDAARLLVNLGADPSICGTVSFDGETIQGAPPLWAAAAAGHLDLVRFLVLEAHVDINQTTHTNSSPLRGACYDGHLEIVRFLVENGANMELANRHGHTPLMIGAFRKKTDVVKFLLSKGASPLKSSYKGNTALHDAAESDCLSVCVLLIEANAPLVDDDTGLCPLMGAALMANINVFPYLVLNCKSPLRIKDAYRILGCSLVDKKMDLEGAFNMWRKALETELDEEERENERERMKKDSTHPLFTNHPEVTTMEQLEEIRDDPDKLRMQALVMRERILGGGHTDVHYYLRLRGAVYCDMGDVNKCYELWNYAIELQQTHLGPLHISTIATLQACQETFCISLNEMIIDGAGRMMVDELPLTFNQIDLIFQKVCVELERLLEWGDAPLHEDCSVDGHEHDIDEEKKKVALIALQLIVLADRLSSTEAACGMKNRKEEKLDIGRFVRISHQLGINLIHIASSDNEDFTVQSDSHHFPSTYCITCLLEAGMSPCTRDEEGKTPLHIIVANKQVKTSIVKVLLEAGGSLYARDDEDETPFDKMKKKKDAATIFKNIPIGKYMNLQDLAALAVQRYGIEYEEMAPIDMHPFILNH